MDSNTHSTSRATSPASPSASQATGPSAGRPDSLATLTAAVEELAAEDLNGLADAVAAERVLGLRRLLDRLEGHWLAELAAGDARGAAGADHGVQAPSTAGWLRNRLHLSHGAAHSSVRTARAVFRGPLTATAKALTDGTISPAHAAVLAHGTQDLPAQVAVEAEPVLVEAAGRLDPPRLRRVLGHLQLAADPEAAEARTERQHGRRGLWLSSTLEGMVAVDGLLDPEAGQIVLAALEPLARPHSAEDARSGGQRRADALTELARRSLEGGTLPKAGGVRPQLSVLVDLASLLGRGPPVGGEAGWAGPLAPKVCRRLACDRAVTRVLVSRQPTSPHRHNCDGPEDAAGHHHPGEHRDATRDPELTDWLRTAAALLPPILGGAPSQPLDLGRTSRVVSPAQHRALAVRDGGCVFPDCGRPLAWCEAHHLWHWLDGGPTDLDNLNLVVPGSSSGGP